MFGTLKGRLIIIAIVVISSVAVLWTRGITLGLDLKGGMYLALEIDDTEGTMTPELKKQNIQQNLQILRNRIDQFGVTEASVTASGDERIVVELPGMDDPERARAVIEKQAFLEFQLVVDDNSLADALRRMDRVVAASIGAGGDTADTAIDPAAAADTTPDLAADVLRQLFNDSTAAADTTTADSADAALPGSTARPLSSLLFQGYRSGDVSVELASVERVKRYLALPGVLEQLPRGTELAWEQDTIAAGAQLTQHLYLLEAEPFLTGDQLKTATAGRDPQFGRTIVEFELNRRGGNRFEEVTSAHIGDRIAIVLDEVVHSAPNVNSAIGTRGQIEMGSSPLAEASDLALVLRAGAFTAPLEVVSSTQIGPTLGEDSIRNGMIAGIVGVLMVIGIMVYFYRFAGLLAVISLTAYSALVLGGLAAFGASLTAPGIAGFILSIGMGVDGNVLIFERIREELTAGRTPRAAVDTGFQQAMTAIIDTHITTLITALILYQIGTGPVQGFAVTLAVGILASFFSSVYVTRTLFLLYLERRPASRAISI